MSPKVDLSASPAPLPSEFRILVEDLRAILWEIDTAAKRFTWVSRHAEEVLGYPVEQWLDQPGFWDDHLHPEDREWVLPKCEAWEAGGEDHQIEYRMIAANGQTVWLRQVVRTVKDASGKLSKLRGVMLDITEQRVAAQALRESEEQFRTLFEDGPIPMILAGPNLQIKAVNQAYCAMLGMEEQELLQLTTPEFIHPDDRPGCLALVQQLFAGEIPSYKVQKRYLNAKGEILWVDVFGTLLRDSHGKPRFGLGIVVDITEHCRAENSLRELSSRLMRLQEEERRRIARELHDSVGQNLAALKLNLSRLHGANLQPGLQAVVTDSLTVADRVLREIRTLSHLLHPPLLDEFGLTSAIRTYARGFRERSGISVYLDIPQNLGRRAPELESAIFRIIQEGLTNVYRHSGGTQCWIAIRHDADTLRLEMRDDGTGLRKDALDGLEKGAPAFGVGLSGMRERARQLGGHLEIESTASGCAVRALFPIHRKRNG